MFSAPLDLLIAFAAITAPGEVPPDAVPLASLSAFAAVAVQMELMDSRTQTITFACLEDFVGDLRWIRTCAINLADAPLSCDAKRFPCREICRQALAANREYRRWLVERKTLGPLCRPEWNDWCDAAIAETDELYQVWDAALDAQQTYYYLTVRRAALVKLRERIGAEAYYAGCLPPSVPTWRLSRAD